MAKVAPKKERFVVYLSPEIGERLRREHGDTRRPYSEIAEEALSRHLDPSGKPTRVRQPA